MFKSRPASCDLDQVFTPSPRFDPPRIERGTVPARQINAPNAGAAPVFPDATLLAGHTSPAGAFLDYVFMAIVSFFLMHKLVCIRQRPVKIAGQEPHLRSPVVIVTQPLKSAIRIAQAEKLKQHPSAEHRDCER